MIKKNSTLIDICGGCGWLKPHLDDSIKYTVADASNEFKKTCIEAGTNFVHLNCKNFNTIKNKYDYSVIIISLYQFKKNVQDVINQFKKNVQDVIKKLKKISKKKVIVVEEIKSKKKINTFFYIKRKVIDYLCYTDFYRENNDLFTFSEFKILMKKNKFILNKKYINNNVLIGVFNIR